MNNTDKFKSKSGQQRDMSLGLMEYVQSKLNIVDVIGEYVSLKKNRGLFTGRCPFDHGGIEKEIVISPTYGTWGSFYCRRPSNYGDIISKSSAKHSGDVFDFFALWYKVPRDKAFIEMANRLGIHETLFDIIPQHKIDKQFETTFSALKLFQQCPRRYKYRYLERQRDQKSTYYLALGRILHNTLAEFLKKDPGDYSLNSLIKVLEDRWTNRGFSDREEEQHFRLRAEEILTNYYSRHFPGNFRVKLIEAPVMSTARGLVISGVVDRIDELSDGSCEIIDYKTEPLVENEENTNKLQLTFYYYGAIESYNLKVSKLTLEYLESNQTVSFTPTGIDLEKQLAIAYNIVDQIQNEGDFKPRANLYCMDCTLASKCPERTNTKRSQYQSPTHKMREENNHEDS